MTGIMATLIIIQSNIRFEVAFGPNTQTQFGVLHSVVFRLQGQQAPQEIRRVGAYGQRIDWVFGAL